MNPLVSIVIPSYNRADLIGDTLDSIQRQSYDFWECIIVDDNSSDSTKEIIEKYIQDDNRFVYTKNKTNIGAPASRNRGLLLSRGKYILFLDSDDILHKKKLEFHLNKFAESDSLDMTFSYDEYFYKTPGDTNILWNIHDSADVISRFLSFDAPFHTQSPIWKKDFLIQKNVIWDTNLESWQDWKFNFTALSNNVQFDHIPLVLGYIRDHDGERISTRDTLIKAKSKLICIKFAISELDRINELTDSRRYLINEFIFNIIDEIIDRRLNKFKHLKLFIHTIFVLLKFNSIKLLLNNTFFAFRKSISIKSFISNFIIAYKMNLNIQGIINTKWRKMKTEAYQILS